MARKFLSQCVCVCVFVCRSVTHAEHIDMFLRWITNCLLFFTLIYLTHTGAENVFSADEGETVNLPCHKPPDTSVQFSVEWIHNSTDRITICKWMITNNVVSLLNECNPRFTFTRESSTITIKDVQLSDSGHYSCKATRIIPPPSLDNMTNVTLQVAVRPHLSLQILNSSRPNDTCVHLLCSMEGLTTEQVNLTWARKGHGSLNPFTSYAMNSELRLCKPDWSEGDTITCYASYSGTQTQKSIQLSSQNDSDKVDGDVLNQLLIISCSAAAGLILCIILTVVICKCRKQDEHGSIVFSNKVYENFSFAMARQNTQPNDKPQPEECIYEN